MAGQLISVEKKGWRAKQQAGTSEVEVVQVPSTYDPGLQGTGRRMKKWIRDWHIDSVASGGIAGHLFSPRAPLPNPAERTHYPSR